MRCPHREVRWRVIRYREVSSPEGKAESWLSLRLREVSSNAFDRTPTGTFVMVLCSMERVWGKGGQRGEKGMGKLGRRRMEEMYSDLLTESG